MIAKIIEFLLIIVIAYLAYKMGRSDSDSENLSERLELKEDVSNIKRTLSDLRENDLVLKAFISDLAKNLGLYWQDNGKCLSELKYSFFKTKKPVVTAKKVTKKKK